MAEMLENYMVLDRPYERSCDDGPDPDELYDERRMLGFERD